MKRLLKNSSPGVRGLRGRVIMAVPFGLAATAALALYPNWISARQSPAGASAASPVQIPCSLVPMVVSPSVAETIPRKKTVMCPDAAAAPGDRVEWVPGEGVGRVHLVRFKGLSPFAWQERTNNGPDPQVADSLPEDAAIGTYGYLVIVVEEGSGRKYASRDPDLDIVPRR